MKKTKYLLTLPVTLAIVASPIIASVSCSSSNNDLMLVRKTSIRTVINGTNPKSGYKFDASFSYGQVGKEFNENFYVPQLIRTSTEGEHTYNVNDTEFREQSKFLKLELAKYVFVTKFNEQVYRFTNDKHELADGSSGDVQSINHPSFAYHLSNAKQVEFVLHEDVKWVNNEGYPVRSNDGENYHQIKPMDYVYGLQRSLMTNNELRNSAYSQSNIFGGYGSLPSGVTEEEFVSANLQKSQKAGSILDADGLLVSNGGYSREYLFDLYGVQSPAEHIKNSTNGKPNMIGSYRGPLTDGKIVETLAIKAKPGSSATNLKDFMTEVVIDTKDFAPAPSQYIDEVSSKILSIKDDLQTLTIEEDTNVAKYGIYTYGTNIKNTLFASQYIASEDNNKTLVIEKNTYYWDSQWVNDPRSVKRLQLDYAPQDDKNVFAVSLLSQYKSGRSFELGINDLPNVTKSEILLNKNNDYGVRYVNPSKKDSFTTNVFPVTLPAMLPKGEDASTFYNFNNGFAIHWFGADSLDEIVEGKMMITDYIRPSAISFRTQLNALLNWYGVTRTASPSGTQEYWKSLLPHYAKLTGAGLDDEYAYDISNSIRDFNDMKYFEPTGSASMKSYEKAFEEEVSWYERSTTQDSKVRSPLFNELSAVLKDTLSDDFVQFSLLNEKQNSLIAEEDAKNRIVSTFNSVGKNLSVSSEGNYNSTKQLLENKKGSWAIKHDFSTKIDETSSFMSGLSNERMSLSAYAILASTLYSENATRYRYLNDMFPTVVDYGNKLVSELNSMRNEYFRGDNAKLRPFFKELSEIKNLRNKSTTNLDSPHLLSSTLFNWDDYYALTDSVEDLDTKQRIATARSFFGQIIFKANNLIQEEMTNKSLFTLFEEFNLLHGNYFGVDQYSFNTHNAKEAKVWSKWLTRPANENGLEFIADWKVK